MGNFLSELKRRHVYRVAAAYVVVAWLILQVVNNIAPGLNLPNSAVTLVIVLLAAGFPIALIFAWIFDIKATRPADSLAPEAKTTGLDYVLLGGLAVVIAIFAYQQVAPSLSTRTEPQRIVAASLSPGISIAVLPFANMSGDSSQEFFSDGMTEEITSALAKLKGLRVIGRTSAFQYKGQSQDLRAIGQALSAGYLIEGSVRKAGDQLRITAQLIKADDGTQLWTEIYDRQLSNIFAIQEDIALAIAGALRVPLGLAQGETLVSNRTSNFESYQQFLRGKALVRAQMLDEAIEVLEPVVLSDPSFAPAWAFLARAYILAPAINPAVRNGSVDEARRIVQSYRIKSDMAARESVRLDSKLAVGYWVLGGTTPPAAFLTRENLYRQALALDANDAETLNTYSLLLANAGHIEESLRFRERLRTQEPLVPAFNLITGMIMRANEDSRAAALPILEAVRLTNPVGILFANGSLAQAYAADGRYAQAADTLLAIPANNLVNRQRIEEAAGLLRQLPVKVTAPESLPVWPEQLNWIYAHAGAPGRLLEVQERNVEVGAVGFTFSVWLPEYAPVRKTERFKALMRKNGIVDYWRARGWPDLCRPLGADDFVCD